MGWIGGSILASLSTFEDMWVTKDEMTNLVLPSSTENVLKYCRRRRTVQVRSKEDACFCKCMSRREQLSVQMKNLLNSNHVLEASGSFFLLTYFAFVVLVRK